jgi:phosphate transport system permease protein
MTALAAETTTAHRDERIARTILFACAALFVGVIALVLLYLLYAGTKLFFHDGLSPFTFLFSPNWDIEDPSSLAIAGNHFGAAPFILGSLIATAFAICVGGPLGVAIGVFFAELAPKRVASIFKPAIEVLVGIPSVVYGWLGLTILVPLIGNVFHLADGDGLLAAGIVLSIMIVPSVRRSRFSSCSEMLTSFRRRSLNPPRR